MRPITKFLSVGLLGLAFGCGLEAPPEDVSSAMCRDRCCGDECCYKGGKWEVINGMTMCCRDLDGNGKECINDPDFWPKMNPNPPTIPTIKPPVVDPAPSTLGP